jgi:hypothetical protein
MKLTTSKWDNKRRAWMPGYLSKLGVTLVIVSCCIAFMGTATQLNLLTQVQGLLPAANGGLNANAAAFTGVLREASGTASAAEFSGDCTTSGSNVITCQKDNGTTVPVNSAANQVLLTTASATGSWATIPDCPSGALQFTASTHVWSCGTVLTGSFADGETPTGLVNGANTTYTLAHTPNPATSLVWTYNGQRLEPGGADFTLATATVTTVTAPPTGTIIRASYRW